MKKILFLHVILTSVLFGEAQSIRHQSLGFTVNIPLINHHQYYNHASNKFAGINGYGGVGLGLFYNTQQSKFSLEGGFTSNANIPQGSKDNNTYGASTSIQSNYVEVLYHRKIFSNVFIVSGVNWINHKFSFTNNMFSDLTSSYINPTPSFKRNTNTIGLSIGPEYRFSKNTSVNLLYRPSFITSNKSGYRHLISIGLGFDFFVKRKHTEE